MIRYFSDPGFKQKFRIIELIIIEKETNKIEDFLWLRKKFNSLEEEIIPEKLELIAVLITMYVVNLHEKNFFHGDIKP